MIRTLNIFSILCLIGLLAVLYHVRYSAAEEDEALRKLEAEILLEQKQAQILRAEYSGLSDPKRLMVLSKLHLGLEYASGAQLLAAVEEKNQQTVKLLRLGTAGLR
jgi:hypothetical protein